MADSRRRGRCNDTVICSILNDQQHTTLIPHEAKKRHVFVKSKGLVKDGIAALNLPSQPYSRDTYPYTGVFGTTSVIWGSSYGRQCGSYRIPNHSVVSVVGLALHFPADSVIGGHIR